MNFRLTADNILVTDHEKVYEILWQFFNEETSEAYPYPTSVDKVPNGVKMWKSLARCKAECYMRNKLNAVHFYEVI